MLERIQLERQGKVRLLCKSSALKYSVGIISGEISMIDASHDNYAKLTSRDRLFLLHPITLHCNINLTKIFRTAP